MNRVTNTSLIILFFLNLIDAYMTLYWIAEGCIVEANPLMKVWLRVDPSVFILLKTIIGTICIWLLWRVREKALVKILVIPTLIIYTCVFFIHCFVALKIFLN